MKRQRTDDERTLSADVPIQDIFVDLEYGRILEAGHVGRITGAWDEKKAGTIYLSLRADGRYACLDGWHRVQAAKAKGVAALLARVYIDLTPQEEADLFDAFNRVRRALTPGEKFKARLFKREPVAVEIDSALKAMGLVLCMRENPANAHVGEVRAIVAVENVHRVRGVRHLTDVLSTLKEAFGSSPDSFNQFCIGGLSAFLLRYGEDCPEPADRDRVINILRNQTVKGMDSAMRLLQSALYGTDARTAWGMSLRQRYNKNLRAGRPALPDWQTRVYTPETRTIRRARLKEISPSSTKAKAASKRRVA